MGRLTFIELHNFKSYKGTQKIDLGDAHFTSIIGPNGAGKSNMMDAISFVLGIRSNHLRSLQLKDLIYRENKLHVDEHDQDLSAVVDASASSTTTTTAPNFAYVSVIYEKENGTSLTLKRSVSDSGSSGSSSYSINDKNVSYAEYIDVLAKENILIKAKNFLVFQGDVESIASQSTEDLTRTIEEISGSIEYKAEYERLKRIQDEAVQYSTMSYNKKRGYVAELKHYKVQKEQAEEFNRKVATRDELVLQQNLWKLYQLDISHKAQSQKLKKLTSTISEAKSQLEEIEQGLDSTNMDYSAAHKTLAKLEHQKTALTRERDDKLSSINPLKDAIESVEEAIHRREVRKLKILEQLKEDEKDAKRLKKDLAMVNKAKQMFEAEILEEERSRSEFANLTEQDRNDYKALKEQVLMETSFEESEIDKLNMQKRALESKLESLQSKVDRAKSDDSRLAGEVESLKLKIDDISATINQQNDQLKKKKKRVATVSSEKKRQERKALDLNRKLETTVKSLLDYSADRRDIDRKNKLREDVDTLKRLIPGVHGLIYDLCQPKQRNYEAVIPTVLGQNFNAVVVDSFSVAQECIKYLKEQRSGVASFIPLDTVVSTPLNGALRDVDRRAKLAIDCVEYPSKVERAIQFACGNTLICDDLQTAKDLRWSKNVDVRCVTLDGAVIHRNNLMTGGKSQSSNDSQNVWQTSKIHQLNSQKDKIIAELQEIAQNSHTFVTEEERLKFDIETIESNLELSRTNLRSVHLMLKSREEQQRHCADIQAKTAPKIKSIHEEVAALNQELANYVSKVMSVKNRVFMDFCRRLAITDIHHYEQTIDSHSDRVKKRTLEFTTQIQRLETQIQYQEQRLADTKSRVESLEQGIESRNEHLQQSRTELESLKEDVTNLDNKLQLLEKEYEQAKASVDKKYEQAQVNKDVIVTAQRAIDRLVRQRVEVQEELEKIRMQKLTTLKNCRIEGISLPVVQGSLDDIPIDEAMDEDEDEDEDGDESQDAMEVDMDDTFDSDQTNKRRRVSGVTVSAKSLEVLSNVKVDYSVLPEELKNAKGEETEQKLADNIKALTLELEKMVVNSHAGERLEDVQERYQEFEKEFERTRREAREAKDRFQEVKRLRYEKFNEAYQHISDEIDDIYKELTKTDAFPMGGSAYLSLDNEDEPYLNGVNYHAMPPMKRFCDMDLLSGGEKTIAALSLLFAIHSYQPSPFFILDEIDAALDNSNVTSISRYIQKNATNGFQFIVISLKNGLYENSESLIGIYRDQELNSSRALTLDLRV